MLVVMGCSVTHKCYRWGLVASTEAGGRRSRGYHCKGGRSPEGLKLFSFFPFPAFCFPLFFPQCLPSFFLNLAFTWGVRQSNWLVFYLPFAKFISPDVSDTNLRPPFGNSTAWWEAACVRGSSQNLKSGGYWCESKIWFLLTLWFWLNYLANVSFKIPVCKLAIIFRQILWEFNNKCMCVRERQRRGEREWEMLFAWNST